MKLESLSSVPELTLPPGTALYRVQLSRARRSTLCIGPLRLAPVGTLSGRFDLADQPVAYFADSPLTALYEALFRREATAASLSELARRSVLALSTDRAMRVLDLRGHANSWPVLQSLRFQHTQALAADALRHGYDGLIYRSAQQHGQDCHALFGDVLGNITRRWVQALVEPHSGGLHRLCAHALMGSQIPLVP